MEKERLKRDLTDNEDSLKTLKTSLKKQSDDCKDKQQNLGTFIRRSFTQNYTSKLRKIHFFEKL